MNMKNSKKGFEMALTTVVIVVILLIVMIIVGSYFLGGVTKTGEKVNVVSENMTGSLGGITDKLGDLTDVLGLGKESGD